MKILFTGASSFTGYWFVQTLVRAGHEIVCPITKNVADYTGLRATRIQGLNQACRLVPQTAFGSENFLQLIGSESFDQLCHHAADVTNYKSPAFDAAAALKNNTRNLSTVLEAMRARGLRAVVLTGTYFEAGEGAGSEPLLDFSPYSLSKALTCGAFQAQCRALGLTLGKFVIPNPFGPLEDPRFTAHLMNRWKAGQPAEVKTPDYVRDNIPVDLLASVYVQFAAQTAAAKSPSLKINPSGYAEKQGAFAQRVARETQRRLGWNCELHLARQEDFIEPLERINTFPAQKLIPDWDEAKAWDAFAGFYASNSLADHH